MLSIALLAACAAYAGRALEGELIALAVKNVGAAATRGEDFSHGLLDRAEVVRAAAKVTRERFPNADDVLVDDHIFVRYRADGTSVTWDDTFIKVLTEKGIGRIAPSRSTSRYPTAPSR